jgi:hypothetical protein
MHPETRADGGQRFNALKHGGYAEAILLPGDDAAAFRRDRRALFHNYRPQTQDEADLVEAMAEHRWVGRRFRLVQAWFDGQAVTPERDSAGRICEPIAHQRLHSGMDVTVHRQRIEKLWHRARAQLMLMQKQRRQGLVAGAVALPQDCYMETDGRVFGPVAQKVIVPIPEPDIEAVGVDRDPPADRMEVHPSADREIGKYQEQKETGPEAVSPEHMDAASARIEPLRTASGGRWTGGFRASDGFAEAPGTAAVGV